MWGRTAVLVGILVVLSAVLVIQFVLPSSSDGVPIPPLPETPFANAVPGVATYVGTETCARCHRDQYESYARTAHSRTLAEIDVADEPPDGEVVHEKSGRRYQIRRDGDQLLQEAWAVSGSGDDVPLGSHAPRYVIGSGRFSRSYLIECDGFLCESPVTWYRSSGQWAMSPGYDQPGHLGFRRVATRQCLDCHAGDVRTVDDTPYKLELGELSVSCERCHGPGSTHVALRERGASPTNAEFDETIVHPGHLSRDLAESICQQCHLNAEVTVAARGREITDFRPGYPLSSFRHEFARNDADAGMTVVGHVEQMHASACYIESESLTCTTCHDPHHHVEEADRVEHYRRICMDCHDDGNGCGLALTEREERSGNDCAECHMPVTDTDIPHFAFRHHRIGIHGDEEPPSEASNDLVVPINDLAALDEIELRRSVGLAAFELFVKGDKSSEALGRFAADELVAVHEAGIRDPHVDAAIAMLATGTPDWDLAVPMAESVLELDAPPARARIVANMVLAQYHLQGGRMGEAEPHFAALTRDRRESSDWFLLGVCRESTDDRDGALRAYEQAVVIEPAAGAIHEQIAKMLRRLDRPDEARRHERLARKLPKTGFEASESPVP